MATVEVLQSEVVNDPSRRREALNFPSYRKVRPMQFEDDSFQALHSVQMLSMDSSLLKTARTVCERYSVDFGSLSQIQRKFLTHHRCSQCGLVPLYYLNLLHATRVRCRKCGELTTFKRTGKYGKLRKEIAFDLVKEIHGDARPVY